MLIPTCSKEGIEHKTLFISKSCNFFSGQEGAGDVISREDERKTFQEDFASAAAAESKNKEDSEEAVKSAAQSLCQWVAATLAADQTKGPNLTNNKV